MEVLLKRWVKRNGERVLVSECDARGVPGSPGAACLICETDSTMRRIWNYPADWQGLDDAKVLALFDQPFVPVSSAQPAAAAKPARPRRPESGQGAAQLSAAAR